MKKDFEEIYNELYSECIKDLKKENAKVIEHVGKIVFILFFINILIFIFIAYKTIFIISSVTSIVILIYDYDNSRERYRAKYKHYVISNIVKKYNENLSYDPNGSLTSIEYKQSYFDNRFNEFYSEDKVYGKLKNGDRIKASEITTYNIDEFISTNGIEEIKTQTFRGFYGYVELEKNILLEINIMGNKKAQKYNKKRIEIDSSEFEKYYDFTTDNKIKAMEIFTPDLTEKYIDIININKHLFEVKIKDDRLYFRYNCGDMFESPLYGGGLDRAYIEYYYNLIACPLEVIERTIDKIYSYLDTIK